MNTMIRPMEEKDREPVIEMMRRFYRSDAVLTGGSDEIFNSDVDQCVARSPYLEGYILECGGTIQGYAMLAKSFSAEFGKRCIWVEDLYIKDEYRNLGIGSCFLEFVEEKYPGSVFRLEVESENEHAVYVYKKSGYKILPYMEMIK
ncbi:MAG: GNAT family N-acetyltransferase [Clostridia bacterium]|nr:GNAT family N-acetyltransferase [Clostridia bacterium]